MAKLCGDGGKTKFFSISVLTDGNKRSLLQLVGELAQGWAGKILTFKVSSGQLVHKHLPK